MNGEVQTTIGDELSGPIRAELHRVLASPQFEASERNRRFLGYVVEERLAGRAGRIKAYNIATEVFRRGVNFDPQLDPVVRMEARRLRKSLEHYYLTEGKGSSIRIAMPTGGYVPEFEHALATRAPTQATDEAVNMSRDRRPAIAVVRFETEGDESIFKHFNNGFANHIMVGLSRYQEFSVFDANLVSHRVQSAETGPGPGEPTGDLVLTGSTALFEGVLNVEAVLVEAGTGRVLWGHSFEHKFTPARLLQLRDHIADSIVRAVAESFGAIICRHDSLAEEKASETVVGTDNLVGFYQYRRS